MARVESPLGLLHAKSGDWSRNLLAAPNVGSLVVTIEAGSRKIIWPAGAVALDSTGPDSALGERSTTTDLSPLVPRLPTGTGSLTITIVSASQ